MSIYIDEDLILDQIDDRTIASEFKARELGKKFGEPDAFHNNRKEDLVRAVSRGDWPEVDRLLRTYFLFEELRCEPSTFRRAA